MRPQFQTRPRQHVVKQSDGIEASATSREGRASVQKPTDDLIALLWQFNQDARRRLAHFYPCPST